MLKTFNPPPSLNTTCAIWILGLEPRIHINRNMNFHAKKNKKTEDMNNYKSQKRSITNRTVITPTKKSTKKHNELEQ